VIVIPAIDLRGGRCVRLREGRADAETVFGNDPVAMARRWVGLGATRLHVVDLDGAFSGQPQQTALVAEIVAAASPAEVEVGGGLRDLAAVALTLASGARYAVLGTRAALDPAFLEAATRAHPGRIIVAVDARGERVAVRGWTETSGRTVQEVAEHAARAGAAARLYTDVSRDGTEQGPNLEITAALARAVGLPVLASGGVAGLVDLCRLAAIPGVAGTIVGRALYTGAVDLREALAALTPAVRASRTEAAAP
jgi:phosphoribosylformimino-5-aminoimidazole carboxamide ribotide isomerase